MNDHKLFNDEGAKLALVGNAPKYRVEIMTGSKVQAITLRRVAQAIKDNQGLFEEGAKDYLLKIADLDPNAKYLWSITMHPDTNDIAETEPAAIGSIGVSSHGKCTIAIHEASLKNIKTLQEANLISKDLQHELGKASVKSALTIAR